MSDPNSSTDHYDVIVVGGAFAGAAFATLLKRWRPETRILVVERRTEFDRKVGEATVEISAFFLHRVLGVYDLLSRGHLPKHGLRYWFTDGPDRSLAEMSEVGPEQLPLLPSFQLDRSKIDEQLLELAVAEGCELARPARASEIDLGWPESRVTLRTEAGERRVSARWVVDASGRRAMLARQLGIFQRTEEHPTAAVWGRWRNVADMDGPGVLGRDVREPELPHLLTARRLATNHFCGYGWWCWAIPLSGGETSIGLVYNKELFQPPGSGPLRDRFERFVKTWPGLRELLADAVMDEKDCRAFGHLPHCASRYAAPGWALVGDAAAFIDPYYSPGLDHVSMSVYATARMLEDELSGNLAGDELDARIGIHNERFARSYRRWTSALYLGKYEVMGDAELCAAAFLFDTAMYYLGVVSPVHADIEELGYPVFGLELKAATIAYRVMRTFNQRLVKLARFRAKAGIYGRRNHGWRMYAKTPGLKRAAVPMLRQGISLWLKAEREYLLHKLFKPRLDLSTPVAPLGAPEPVES